MELETQFSDGVLTIRRAFSQPVAEVFDAWIDAAKTSHWWGCADTTKVVSHVEPQIGGKYRHTMTITNVGEHTVDGQILEFDPPNSIKYSMPADHAGDGSIVHVTFEEMNNGTMVTLTQTKIASGFEDIVRAGWTSAFGRLAAYFLGARRAA